MFRAIAESRQYRYGLEYTSMASIPQMPRPLRSENFSHLQSSIYTTSHNSHQRSATLQLLPALTNTTILASALQHRNSHQRSEIPQFSSLLGQCRLQKIMAGLIWTSFTPQVLLHLQVRWSHSPGLSLRSICME